MFDDEIKKIEDMMVDYCEYNPMILAQRAAFGQQNEPKKCTFNYGNFSIKDYLKAFCAG